MADGGTVAGVSERVGVATASRAVSTDEGPVGLRVALVVWPAAVALAVDPWGWFPFGPVKWLVVSAGVLLLLALASRRALVLVRSVQWSSVATVAAMALAAAASRSGWLPWVGTEDRHLGVVTWILGAIAVVVGQSLRRSQLDGLLWGLTVAGLGLGAASTAEALRWEPRVFAVDARLTSTFGSAAYLGAATALLLPVMTALVFDRWPGRARRAARARRIAAGVAVPLLQVASIGSGARAAWFGLVVSAVVAVACNGGRVLAVARRHRGLAGGVAIAGVAGVAVLVVMTPAGGRLAGLTDLDRPGGSSRIDEWRVAAAVAVHHPVVGVGPEDYRLAFPDGVDDDYVHRHGRDVVVDRAHAAPLDVVLAGGALALAAWLAWLIATGRFIGRALRVERGAAPVFGLAAGVVAYGAAQLLLFPLSELDPLAWLMAGAVVGATAKPAEVRTAVVGSWLTVVAVIGFVLASVAGVAGVVADEHARHATVLADGGDAAPALATVDDALRWRPDSVRLRLLRADLALAAGRGSTDAIAPVDDALVVAPDDPLVERRRTELLVARAEATQLPQHIDVARDAAAARLTADPHDPALWLLAARVAVLDGRVDLARVDADRAVALDPHDAAAVAVRRRLGDG
jgi:hypothetical protein